MMYADDVIIIFNYIQKMKKIVDIWVKEKTGETEP